MITDSLKNFIEEKKIVEKGKPLAIAAVCFAVVFIAGFGAGKLQNSDSASGPRSLNYTTNANTDKNPAANTANTNSNTNSTAKPTNSATATTSGDCPIKGSKSKIYHVPGGAFYDRTAASQCFATEAEAQVAGYTKSSR